MPTWPEGTGDQESKGLFPHKLKQRAAVYYQQYIEEFLLRRKPLPPSKDGRRIPLRCACYKPLFDERRGRPYISNVIRSSRYTIWDFLPKQIMFQCFRLHNFYFICIGIPQAIPGFSTTGSYTTVLPVLFFLLLTIFKEAFDDYRRHRMDNAENRTIARVLRHREQPGIMSGLWNSAKSRLKAFSFKRGARPDQDASSDLEMDEMDDFHWARIEWQHIEVGDIIKIGRDDTVPADVVLLYSTSDNGLAYIDTMALDGETNLKSKQSLPAFRACSNIQGVHSTEAEFVLEDPNPDLRDFNGRATVGGKKLPLTLTEVLYRSSVLRNTEYVLGLVVNTGEECKIRMNANHHPPAKKPRLEHFCNQIIISLIVYVVIVAVGCSIGYIIWQRNTEERSWYIQNAPVDFKEVIIGYLIMFNNVIPLAMYVSLEIVKLGQMVMLNSDVEMYDEATDTPMRCNTNTILENLGQISFVLTDKTGTLTENIMKFRKMSIMGTTWAHQQEVRKLTEQTTKGESSVDTGPVLKVPRVTVIETLDSTSSRGTTQSSVDNLSIPKVPRVTVTETSESTSSRGTTQSSINNLSNPKVPRVTVTETPDSISSRGTVVEAFVAHSRGQIDYEPTRQTEPSSLELIERIEKDPYSLSSRRAREFILAMALCNTCLPEVHDGLLDYQASSPDELALVRAAQDLNYVMTQRTAHSITLETGKSGMCSREVYEILDVIEFSSSRKRMTIILRCPDGRIWLICKGADTTIVPLLQQSALATAKRSEVRSSVDMERKIHRESMQSDRRKSSQFCEVSGLGWNSRSDRGHATSFEMSDMSPCQKSAKTAITVTATATSLDAPRGSAARLHPKISWTESALASDAIPSDDAAIFTRTFDHLNDFATVGLRTLMFAHKTISASEYAIWKQTFLTASTALTNRQALIESAAESIEHSLQLLGASAIEDKLQTGVPDTIDRLRRANMRIWMLTGDKRETALNIAHSARIVLPDSEVFTLDIAQGDVKSQLDQLDVVLHTDLATHVVAVIDGNTLATIEAIPALRSFFYYLIPSIASVICCRASPAQKAAVVTALKVRVPQALTLAIGDGANDIAMLQAAHVGVGISGHEGLAASRVADYSIGSFRFLARLLLVHGHWSYDRTAKFILWTFWKEMFFYLPQALFQMYNGYTGTSLYENWSLTALNTLFTSLCVISPAVWEQDLSAVTLLAVPELYTYGQRNLGLNIVKHLAWTLGATVEAVVAWYVAYAAYSHFNLSGPTDQGLFAFGDVLFSIAIMWTNVKLLLFETHHKTWVILGSFAITTAGWWAWNMFLSAAYDTEPTPYAVRGGFLHGFGKDFAWWMSVLLVMLALCVGELAFKSLLRAWRGSEEEHTDAERPRWRRQSSSLARWERKFDRWMKRGGGNGAGGGARASVEMWQEREQQPRVKRRLEEMAKVADVVSSE